jgi:subtilisin-like proprotein convertase family protein
VEATPAANIPDGNLTGVSSFLNGPNLTITDLQVEVDITHGARGDLEMELRSPQGTIIALHRRKGGSTPDLVTTYPDLTVPEASLDLLRGQSALGQWVLTVRDVSTGVSGTLNRWKLLFDEAPVGATVLFSGTAVYQDREVLLTGLGNATDRPIRFADVEVYRTSDQVVLARGDTDASGVFSLTIPQGGTVNLGVRIFTRQASPFYKIEVKNDATTSALYSLSVTGDYDTSTAVTQNVAATGDDAGGVFNILDQAVTAFDEMKVRSGTDAPKLTLFWKPGSSDGTYFTTLDSSIHLLGAATDNDAFDDDVILHEIGHFAQFSYSRSDSPGGSHSPQQDHQDPRLAFSEGWANYFSSAVRNDPEARDINIGGTSTFELEGPSFSLAASGQDSENTVGAVLWDLFDGAGDDPMALSDGADRIWKVIQNQFASPRPTILETFRSGWPLEHGADFHTQEFDEILRAFQVDLDRLHLFIASPSRAIPDQGEVVEFLSVPQNLTLESVHVFLDLDHPLPTDLVVTLISPQNRQVVLLNRGATPGILPSRPGDPGVYDWFQSFEQAPFESLSGYQGESSIGTWQLRVQDTQSGLTGTLNNWSLDLRGNPPGLPDLRPTVVSGPGAAVGGGTINISYTVKNEGTAASAAFQVRAVLSADRTITLSDSSLGTALVNGLTAGAEFSGSLSGSVPNLTDGNYTLGLVADDLGQIAEGDETNNAVPAISSIALTQAQTGTNLTVPQLSVPTSGVTPGSLQVSSEIFNQGFDPAGAFRLGYFLSTDDQITLADTLLAEVSLNGLAGASSVADSRSLTLPAGLLEGSYYLGAMVDTGFQVAETKEGDNVTVASNSTALTRATSGVDLIAQVLTAPAGASLGAAFSVALESRNGGNQDSPNFDVSIFLSTNASTTGGNPVDFAGFLMGLLATTSESSQPLETNDRSFTFNEDPNAFNALFGLAGGEGVLLGTVTLSPLTSGQTRVDNISVTVPSSQPAGSYFLIASVDPQDQVGEGNENNNVVTSSSLTQVGAAQLPDLIPTTLVGPTLVARGQDISLTRTVTNAGGLGTGASFSESYYLITGDSIQVGDTLLGTFSQSALNSGAGDVRTRTLSIPLTAPLTSSARFALRVDSGNVIAEILETNNDLVSASGSPVVVTAASNLPDLVPTRIVFQGQGPGAALVAGTVVRFETRVENQGVVPAALGTRSRILLSSDLSAAVPPDRVLAEFDTAPISPGGVQNLVVPVTLPVDLVGGDYFLGLEVDLGAQLTELSEANNSFVSTAPVVVSSAVAGIDLYFSQVGEPFVATAGTSMAMDILLVNRGTLSFTTPFFTRFYLSDDDLFDGGDRLLGPAVQTPGMAALGQQALRPRLDLPDQAIIGPGPFYLVGVTDTTSQVAEVDETNNVLVTANSFSLSAPLPELRLSNIALGAPTVPKGGVLEVTSFIENLGTASTGSSFSLDFFLYRDALDPTTLEAVLNSFSVPVLDVAGSLIRQDAVSIPSGDSFLAGTYDLCAQINTPAVFAEAGTASNDFCRLGLVISDVSVPPDYTPTEVSAPLAAFQGGFLRISRRIDNIGQTAATTSSTVGYYLSNDSTIELSDLRIGEQRIVPILSGGNQLDSFQATIPSSTVPGTYYVGVIADILDQIGDGNPSNNSSAATLLTTIYGSPDLIMQALTAPAAALTGGQLQVDRTITNIGQGDEISGFLNRYYLSLDTTFDGQDFLLGVDGVAGLAPGIVDLQTLFFDLPTQLSPGTYFLGATVDATDLSQEIDETNNRFISAGTVTLQGAPDLLSLSVSAISSGVTSTPLVVTGKLKNVGNLPALVPLEVDFFLSPDGNYNSTDPYVGTTMIAAPINPLREITVTASFTVPATTPGDYFLYMELDGSNAILEANESQDSNNVLDPTTFTLLGPDATPPVPSLTILDSSTGREYPNSDFIPAGVALLQVDFGEPVVGPPLLALSVANGPDLPPSAMTRIDPAGAVWRLAYTVQPHDGSQFVDGGREVSIIGVEDLAGNPGAPLPTTENFFSVDTISPVLLEPLTPADRGTHPMGSMTIFGISDDASPVEVLLSVDAGPFTTQVAFQNPGMFSFVAALSAANVHTYQLLLRDRAGNQGLSPLRTVYTDADGDTLPDFWEMQHTGGLGALAPGQDFDADGLTDEQEFLHGTSPVLPDTDGDGISDGIEVAQGSDPVNAGNLVPVAVAQANSSGPPRLVTLSGVGSFDGNGDPLTYRWTQVSGPTLTLADPGGQSTSAVFLTSGTYLHQLVVNDGRIDSPAAQVQTIVSNLPPEGRVFYQQVVEANGSILLDAGGSRDPNADIVNHNWSEDAGNPSFGVLSTFSEAITTMTVLAGREGTYRFTDLTDDGVDPTLSPGVAEVVVLRSGVTPPAADPGPDQVVPVGVPVTLIGSGSRDPEQALAGLTFLWTLDPSNPVGGIFQNPGPLGPDRPRFTATQPGAYRFSLRVSDGAHLSPAREVLVVADSTGSVPHADPGPTAVFLRGDLAVLGQSGTSSGPPGVALGYQWTQTEGVPVELVGATGASPYFYATHAGDYRFQLVVTAGGVASPPSELLVRVLDPGNGVPRARVGYQALAPLSANGRPDDGGLVRLDASASSDDDPLSYSWRQLQGPWVRLQAAGGPTPLLTPPPGSYLFEVTVSDGIHQDRARVSFSVDGSNEPPIVVEPGNQAPVLGAIVTLSAQGTVDPDGGTLEFFWVQTEGPPVTLLGQGSSAVQFLPPRTGDYEFLLRVFDEFDWSVPVVTRVTVQASSSGGGGTPSGGGGGTSVPVLAPTQPTITAEGGGGGGCDLAGRDGAVPGPWGLLFLALWGAGTRQGRRRRGKHS